MNSLVRRAWQTMGRYPRITILLVSLAVIGGTRSLLISRTLTMLNQTDRSEDEAPGCSSNSTCRSKWEHEHE